MPRAAAKTYGSPLPVMPRSGSEDAEVAETDGALPASDRKMGKYNKDLIASAEFPSLLTRQWK